MEFPSSVINRTCLVNSNSKFKNIKLSKIAQDTRVNSMILYKVGSIVPLFAGICVHDVPAF